MLKLPQITLVAIGSTNLEGMARALEYSIQDIEFGAVKLITDKIFALDNWYDLSDEIRINQIDEMKSIDEWNRAVVFDLGDYIKTPYALLIHPDGFVVHPEAWRDEFLNYDYVGSPWPLPTDYYSYRDINGQIQRVGNSISLRSKKLLRLPKKLGMPWQSYFGNTNEDGYICVNNRHIFEEHGCKFAPLEVAAKFGREVPLPENENLDPFVFHKHQGPNAKYPNFEDE